MVSTRRQTRVDNAEADEQRTDTPPEQAPQGNARMRSEEERRFRRLVNSAREAMEEHPASHHPMKFVQLLHGEQLDSALFLWIALLIINEAVIRLAPTLMLLRTLSTISYIYMPYCMALECGYIFFVPMRRVVSRLVIDADIAVKLVSFAIIGNVMWASVYGAYCLTVWLQIYKLPGDQEVPGPMLCPGVVPFDGMAWNETAGCWGLPAETGLMEV